MRLLSATRRELGFFGLAGLLLAAGVLFEPYNPEQPYSFEESKDVQRDHLSLSERLGYAILLRSGYGTASLVPDHPSDDGEQAGEKGPPRDVHIEFTFRDGHSDLRCLNEAPPLELPGAGNLNVQKLTVSILAAEKYNRPPAQRRLERWLAGASLRLRDRLPDFSYGLAQIRPATARRLLHEELGEFQLPDRDLLEILLDDCYNVRLATQYVESLAHGSMPAETIDEVITKVALAYSGAITPTVNGLHYVDAVTGAYDLLTWEDSGEEIELEMEAEPGPERVITACTFFSPGDISGSAVEDTLVPEGTDVSTRADREVRLYFSNKDRGPATYVKLLQERRRNWLVNRLTDFGFSRNKISVLEADLPAAVIDTCDDDADLSWAGIEIEREEAAEVGNQSGS